MERRNFLTGAVAAGAAVAAASSFPAPAISQGRKQLRMVTSWPKNFPGLGTAAARFGQRLTAASNGKYQVKVFAGGELVHPLKCNDAVQQGTADLYHSADYYYQGKSQAYAWYTAVPGGFSPAEMNAWIYHLGGQKLWDEVGANFGVKHLMCGNSAHQMAGWFKKPITSLEDFKGLKMRIPGLGGAVIKALGGTSVTLAGAEILPALQAGTIDATEWVGPWNDLAFGFYKVVKNAHYPGIHEPGSMLSLGISKKLWDGLSKTDKAMFEACAGAENDFDLAEFNANNTQALNTLVTRHGVKYTPLPQEVFKGMAAAAKDVVADAGKKDALSGKVYDSYIKARKTLTAWTRISDQAYFNMRDLVKY